MIRPPRIAASAALAAAAVALAAAVPAGATSIFTEAPGSPYAATGNDPYTVGIGRFNGDDKPDIVVGRFGGAPKIYLGNGDGTFAPAPGAVTIEGFGAFTIAIARVNADTIDDIVLANTNSAGGIDVLLGDGAGGYAPASASPFPGANPTGVAAGDMNGDGKTDIVDTNASGTNVLLGDGAGGFTPAAGSPFAGGDGGRIALGRLNSDQALDVVYEAGGPNTPVLLGNGLGGLAPASGSPFATGTSYGGWPLAADMDGDGRDDVVLAHNSSLDFKVSVMHTAPSGAVSHVPGSPFPVVSPFEPALADIGGDGALDVVVPSFNSGQMNVLLGDGTGFLRAMTSSPFAISAQPSHVAVADLNGDGNQDLVYIESNTQNAAHVLLGRPALTASARSTDLGAVDLGSAATATVLTLTNTSGLTVRLGSANVSGPQAGEFALADDGCTGRELGPGAGCTITGRFAAAAAGARNANLRITEGGSAFNVALSGTGRTPAAAPPPDKTAPRITVSGIASRISRTTFRRRGVRVTVATDEPATVRAVLLARVLRRGKAIVFQAAVGDLELSSRSINRVLGSRVLTLKPSARLAPALRNRRMRLIVRITASDTSGNSRTATRSVLVR